MKNMNGKMEVFKTSDPKIMFNFYSDAVGENGTAGETMVVGECSCNRGRYSYVIIDAGQQTDKIRWRLKCICCLKERDVFTPGKAN
jgi:hypothetical protein